MKSRPTFSSCMSSFIVEKQDAQREDGGYAFVHWSEAHVELRHTKELVKFEMMESFIEKNLIWHL